MRARLSFPLLMCVFLSHPSQAEDCETSKKALAALLSSPIQNTQNAAKIRTQVARPPMQIREYLAGHKVAAQWYRESTPLHDIDPVFIELAKRQDNEVIYLGGGSDLVQSILGVPKNLAVREVNTVPPLSELYEVEKSWFRYSDVNVPAYKGRPAQSLDIDINPESAIDLKSYISNIENGLPLTHQNNPLNVPLKSMGILRIDSQGKARLYFRTSQDRADFEAKVLRLPRASHQTAEEWLEELSVHENGKYHIANTLRYSMILAIRGRSKGWRLDTPSLQFLKKLLKSQSLEQQSTLISEVRQALLSARVEESDVFAIFKELDLLQVSTSIPKSKLRVPSALPSKSRSP